MLGQCKEVNLAYNLIILLKDSSLLLVDKNMLDLFRQATPDDTQQRYESDWN